MTEAIDMKFDQNPELAQFLLDTREFTLHEATPDMYYGIGAMLNSREMRNKQFPGLNKLGLMLEAKRASLRAMTTADTDQG